MNTLSLVQVKYSLILHVYAYAVFFLEIISCLSLHDLHEALRNPVSVSRLLQKQCITHFIKFQHEGTMLNLLLESRIGVGAM